MSETKLLLSEEQIRELLDKMTGQIIEMSDDPGSLALIGIQRGGVVLANRLKQRVESTCGAQLDLGRLDITLHRDDLSTPGSQPIVRESHIPFDVNGRTIILVDDVLCTGRTVRAALNAIMNYGRAQRIILLVLIDRGLRELPIQGDICGLEISSTPDHQIEVHLAEQDGEDKAVQVME